MIKHKVVIVQPVGVYDYQIHSEYGFYPESSRIRYEIKRVIGELVNVRTEIEVIGEPFKVGERIFVKELNEQFHILDILRFNDNTYEYIVNGEYSEPENRNEIIELLEVELKVKEEEQNEYRDKMKEFRKNVKLKVESETNSKEKWWKFW